jgi:hypothetical protein
VDALVLWDPITDGKSWINELVELSRRPLVPLEHGSGVEMGKQAVSHGFVEQVENIDFSSAGPWQRQPTLCLETQNMKFGLGGIPETPDTEVVRLSQPAPWIEDVATGSGQIPVQAVKTIVDWVGSP